MHAAERDRADVVEKRKLWQDQQPLMDAGRLVFLDESGVNINMVRRYGRAVGRARVHDKAPINTPSTTTILSSVRADGEMIFTSFTGPVNGERFREYLENLLAPSLRPGDIVIMDNLRVHKIPGIKERIKAAGATILYLPPYSPDFNPIEKLWSKIKAYLRKVRARCADVLASAITAAFELVSTKDIAGWFCCAGY